MDVKCCLHSHRPCVLADYMLVCYFCLGIDSPLIQSHVQLRTWAKCKYATASFFFYLVKDTIFSKGSISVI